VTSVTLLARDTVVMLRTSISLIRIGAVIAVGVGTFTGSSANHGTTVAQIIAYAVGAVLVVGLTALGRPAGAESPRPLRLSAALVAMAACSAVATSTNGGAMVTFAIIAALTAGSETSLVAGWTVTVVGILAIEIGGLVAGASTSSMVGYPLLAIVALLTGLNRRSYQVQADQASVMLKQIEALRAEQRQVAVLDERSRIAREIHDVLAHSLGALSIQIQTSRALLSDRGDIEGALVVLDKAQRMTTDGLTETRRAVLALRNDTAPLADQLAQLVANHLGRHDVAPALSVQGDPRTLTPDAELALLRVAQESLVNVAKHSADESVTVVLDYTGQQTTLTITNPLRREREPSQSFGTVDGGYGLVGMRERLLLLDGSLAAGPDRDHWTVTAEVPQ
jgi:signal transduction histidine kinase